MQCIFNLGLPLPWVGQLLLEGLVGDVVRVTRMTDPDIGVTSGQAHSTRLNKLVSVHGYSRPIEQTPKFSQSFSQTQIGA